MILALDPGTHQTAFVLYDRALGVCEKGILPNAFMLSRMGSLSSRADHCVIEMIACYGMAVGREVFETCVWIGRFSERWYLLNNRSEPRRLFRKDVKMHLCNSVRAKDGNVRACLLDRFGGRKAAIGSVNAPGPLQGVSKDMWAALGVAVTFDELYVNPDPRQQVLTTHR
jgi:hypothetical protein